VTGDFGLGLRNNNVAYTGKDNFIPHEPQTNLRINLEMRRFNRAGHGDFLVPSLCRFRQRCHGFHFERFGLRDRFEGRNRNGRSSPIHLSPEGFRSVLGRNQNEVWGKQSKIPQLVSCQQHERSDHPHADAGADNRFRRHALGNISRILAGPEIFFLPALSLSAKISRIFAI
jgi:hypothetical protein